MRTLSTQAQSLLSTPGPIPVVALVEMQLSEPLYLCTAGVDIDWDGKTWRATGVLGAIDAVKDTTAELAGLKLTLSGVPSESIAMALGENVQGKPCIVRIALLDRDTHAVVDVQTVWSGTLDQMPLTDGPNPSLAVTAEHRGVTMQRPKAIRYTDADQQRLYPGDKFLEYVNSQANKPIVWPAASYFRK